MQATRLKSTIFSNRHYLVGVDDKVIGIVFDAGTPREYCLMKGDDVYVSGDNRGNICPGIYHPGIGKIANVRRDDTDHWFYVIMENGECGLCKPARLTKI